MSLDINNVLDYNSYGKISSSDSNDSEKIKKSKKDKHTITLKEGPYYCIYSIDGEGKATLIKKIPVFQVKDKNILGIKEADNIKKAVSVPTGADEYECKKQLQLEETHRKNIREIVALSGKLPIA